MRMQNLNERRSNVGGEAPPKGLPTKGRMWFDILGVEVRVEWVLGTLSCGARIAIDQGEAEIKVRAALPGAALYLGLHSRHVYRLASWLRIPQYKDREIGVDVHHGSVWWTCWADPDCWSSADPKWRRGSLDLADVLLGKAQHSERTIETRNVTVPMQERGYQAKATLVESSWKRPRWPWARRVMRTNVEMIDPIPVPHKHGGEDALYSQSRMASSIEQAVGAVVGDVLRDRVRRGGTQWRPATKETPAKP